MAQQKKTGTAGVDEASLPRLTDKQERYLQARLSGKNRSESIMAATDTSNWSRSTVWRKAHELEHHPKIIAWRAAISATGIERGLYTREQHMSELDDFIRAAKAAGNYGAAGIAIANKGKVAQLYVEQVRHTTEDVDVDQLLDQIQELAGEEARNKAARRLGVETTSGPKDVH